MPATISSWKTRVKKGIPTEYTPTQDNSCLSNEASVGPSRRRGSSGSQRGSGAGLADEEAEDEDEKDEATIS